MTRPPDHLTWAARSAVVVASLLAVLQLFWAGVRAEDGDIIGLATLLGVLTMLSAIALGLLNSFEARFGVLVMAGAQILLMSLALLFGLPGHARHPLDRQAVVALALSAAVLALLAIDHRLRARSRDPGPLPPYAL